MANGERVMDVVVAFINVKAAWRNPEDNLHKLQEIRQACPLELGSGIRVEYLDSKLVKELRDACSPRCFPVEEPPLPVGFGRQAYSFVRDHHSPNEQWDPDNHLGECLALSRLIQPNGTGFRCSGTVRLGANSSLEDILPGPWTGDYARVYTNPAYERDFLSLAELRELAKYVTSDLTGLPRRVKIARWHHEHACHSRFIEQRWTEVVTGIEALLNTNKEKVTAQFKRRGVALACEFKLDITDEQLGDAYDKRSKLTHGEINGIPSDQNLLYTKIETLLRKALHLAVAEPSFAQVFADESAIRERWPL